MATARPRVSPKDKTKLMATSKCYVCEDLQLDHAGFEGYDARDVHLDHYQVPFGNLGATSTAVLPIHAAGGGSIPDDSDFETSTTRNCHRLRGNEFTSRGGYVAILRARLNARSVSYIDDVPGNESRNVSSRRYVLPVQWDKESANFIGRKYPVVSEERKGVTWRRFLTTLPPERTFTDRVSQVRPAARKTIVKMVHTFLADGFPMFAPVNARVDSCGHVVIFDGNHRATSHALAFGVEAPMPVMIWDIDSGAGCAMAERLSAPKGRTKGRQPKETKGGKGR